MRTFSHALITAAATSRLDLKRNNTVAAILGSIIPDVPLYILTLYTMLSSPSFNIGMDRMHTNYESNIFWIASHNLFHSLVILGTLSLVGLLFRKKVWAQLLLWFCAGATLHSVIDIFTHAGDGPCFLFPLSYYRFDSPVSYWDSSYFGRQFTIFEYTLDFLMIIFLVFGRLKWFRLQKKVKIKNL